MKSLVILACALIAGCASSNQVKPATKLSGDELSSLIAQYEQDMQPRQADTASVNN